MTTGRINQVSAYHSRPSYWNPTTKSRMASAQVGLFEKQSPTSTTTACWTRAADAPECGLPSWRQGPRQKKWFGAPLMTRPCLMRHSAFAAAFTNSNLPSRCWYTSLSFSRAEARSHPQQSSHHDPNSSRAGWWEGRRLVNLEPGWVNSGKSVEQIKKHRYNLSGS